MTLHISDKTQRLLVDEAKRQQMNPEELAEKLIQRGLLVKKRDLSNLAGTWSDEEVKIFEESVASLQQPIEDKSA
jgi:hypothetical protein